MNILQRFTKCYEALKENISVLLTVIHLFSIITCKHLAGGFSENSKALINLTSLTLALANYAFNNLIRKRQNKMHHLYNSHPSDGTKLDVVSSSCFKGIKYNGKSDLFEIQKVAVLWR